jgi:hypothetical protein
MDQLPMPGWQNSRPDFSDLLDRAISRRRFPQDVAGDFEQRSGIQT